MKIKREEFNEKKNMNNYINAQFNCNEYFLMGNLLTYSYKFSDKDSYYYQNLEIVVLIASFYGLRRSKVLGLKWSSINFEKNIITIKHKVIQRNAKKNRSMVLKDKTKNKSSYRSLPLLPTIATA